jgi:hypothetical protein
MKSKRLRRLQTWTIVALFLYLLMLGHLVVVTAQHAILFQVTAPWWQATVEQRIESDKTVQELQSDFRVSTQRYSLALQVERHLLQICTWANIAMIGFLGWSTFMISRIKREVGHVASQEGSGVKPCGS